MFLNRIMNLFVGAKSAVIINRRRSKSFNIDSGVRQGDPISGFLFIISMELLAIAIRNDNKIKGLIYGKYHKKINMHCDDVALWFKDAASYNRAFGIINSFEKASGLKINTKFYRSK